MNLETSRPNRDLPPTPAEPQGAMASGEQFVPSWQRFKGMAIFAVVLIVLFARPLLGLLKFAPHAELYSHTLLIPFISAYLIWMKRDEVVPESKPNRALAILPLTIGAIVLISYRVALSRGWTFETPDYLAVMIFAFLCFLLVGAFVFVGARYLKSITFPVAFLFFSVPFPVAVRHAIEVFFEHGSAETAYRMLTLSRMPVFREGTYFKLPGFELNVAPACSGIHSSLILLITSLLAGYLFLRTPSRRWVLVLSVIPLALLRNGFRVFTLGQIGVRFDPFVLDSWLHHHGGIIFFLLSLIPFFLLLKYLLKSEVRKQPVTGV
jgi:exosortase C (VPDSG-CTERM-specific)